MSSHSTRAAGKRRRFAPIALISGLAGALLLSLSLTGTLSGFAAQITGSNNTAASGTLTMQETGPGSGSVCNSTDGGSVSVNTATCSTINKLGGSTALVPGTPVTTDVTITNTGTVAARTFILATGGACVQSNNGTIHGSATNFCSKLNVLITSGSTTVFNGTAQSLGAATAASFTMPAAPIAGASVPFIFQVTLDSTADNTYQGLAASVPLVWNFAS